MTCAMRVHADPRQAFNLRDFVRECADRCMSEGAYRRCSGRISLSVTDLPALSARRLRTFRSNAHLRDALLASCCMTPLAGWPFRLDGTWAFDGGLTDFCPSLSEAAVTVSPFYCSRADIRPSRYVPMWWALFPPSVAAMQELYELGFADAHRWVCAHPERVGRVRLSAAGPLSQQPQPRGVRGPAGRGDGPADGWEDAERGEGSEEGTMACGVPQGLAAGKVGAEDAALAALLRAQPPPVRLQEASTSAGGLGADILLLCVVFLVVKPAVFALAYCELFLRALTCLLAGVATELLPACPRLPSAPRPWRRALWFLRSTVSARMALQTVPGFNAVVPFNVRRVYQQSLVYRITHPLFVRGARLTDGLH